MNIKELEQAAIQAKEEMDAAELEITKIEDNLYYAECTFEAKAFAYEMSIEELYEAQQQEISERGVK